MSYECDINKKWVFHMLIYFLLNCEIPKWSSSLFSYHPSNKSEPGSAVCVCVCVVMLIITMVCECVSVFFVFVFFFLTYRLFWYQVLTCVSVRLRAAARSMRSCTLRYFCRSKLLSSWLSWWSVKAVRALRGFFVRIGGLSLLLEISRSPSSLVPERQGGENYYKRGSCGGAECGKYGPEFNLSPSLNKNTINILRCG